jgi:thiol-disulfide isomerase/thioredoxin
MKNHYYLLILLLSLFGCNEGQAVFTIHSKNYGQYAVIGIYDPKTDKPLTLDNIKNGDQQLQLNLIDPSYAILRVPGALRNYDYWVYLKKGNYDITIDANNIADYPVTSSPGEEGKEFIAFYQIKKAINKSITDSLEKATLEFDNSTRETVTEKAKIMGMWANKSRESYLQVVRNFARKYPKSMHTPFLLDQFGQVETEALTYAAIFESLDEEVKNSKAGKKLFAEINIAKRIMEGSSIPVIEGTNPAGQSWDANKFLQQVNVIICWTTYDNKVRRENPQLVALYKKYKNKGVEFIGLSYDKNRKWWTDVIRDDQLSWPQFTDLKGASSPNAKAFSNQRIPYMLLTDKKGKILVSEVNVENLDFEIKSHLKKTE